MYQAPASFIAAMDQAVAALQDEIREAQDAR